MSRTLRILLGAMGIAIVAVVGYLTPAVSAITRILLVCLSAVALGFVWLWPRLEARREDEAAAPAVHRLRLFDLVLGFIANFFDTLGIGSFAPTTAALKFARRIPDEQIPGTLNVGHALPTLTEGLIFIAAIVVNPLLLATMIVASILGAWLGAGVVARLPRRTARRAWPSR